MWKRVNKGGKVAGVVETLTLNYSNEVRVMVDRIRRPHFCCVLSDEWRDFKMEIVRIMIVV
jgi:hypothetical protein